MRVLLLLSVLRSGVPLFRNGSPRTAVMAGLDPAIHDELKQFETLHGPPGQARG
jgi:hypothetical protein